ncbi:MAG: thiamine pyrophosphate-dependent dehydrogenase E1 component subunit alpha [Deltaproteobacteria bacterium]|nr:thiamine pyrophosphate-dependent dehydrogenase E1 component subunit alpha [Deltaproteobacteria bacterium]
MKLERDDLLKLYRNMVLTRKTDESIIDGIKTGRVVSFFHSGQGHEATDVGGVTFLRKGDWAMAGVRGHGVGQAIAKGLAPREFLAEHCGKATGCCFGWSGFHTANLELGLPGYWGTVGTTFPITLGLGIACKKDGKGNVVVSYFGDGASGRGTLHEAFNMTSIYKLPVVWLCENNMLAINMPASEAVASKDVADLAYGYNMPGVVVDGQDVVAVAEAVMIAVERARAGDGPSLVECKTFRFRPHSEGGKMIRGYQPIPEEEIAEWRSKDPIVLFRKKLIEQGIAANVELDKIDGDAAAEIAVAEKFVAESPLADPERMFNSLYA